MYCFRLMVFNATFNNISVILWQSDLLVEETVNLTTMRRLQLLHLFMMLYNIFNQQRLHSRVALHFACFIVFLAIMLHGFYIMV